MSEHSRQSGERSPAEMVGHARRYRHVNVSTGKLRHLADPNVVLQENLYGLISYVPGDVVGWDVVGEPIAGPLAPAPGRKSLAANQARKDFVMNDALDADLVILSMNDDPSRSGNVDWFNRSAMYVSGLGFPPLGRLKEIKARRDEIVEALRKDTYPGWRRIVLGLPEWLCHEIDTVAKAKERAAEVVIRDTLKMHFAEVRAAARPTSDTTVTRYSAEYDRLPPDDFPSVEIARRSLRED